METWKINLVVGGISTCLIEAFMFGAMSISITPGNLYGNHMIRDGLVVPFHDPDLLAKYVETLTAEDIMQFTTKQHVIHQSDDQYTLKEALSSVLEN